MKIWFITIFLGFFINASYREVVDLGLESIELWFIRTRYPRWDTRASYIVIRLTQLYLFSVHCVTDVKLYARDTGRPAVITNYWISVNLIKVNFSYSDTVMTWSYRDTSFGRKIMKNWWFCVCLSILNTQSPHNNLGTSRTEFRTFFLKWAPY